MENVERESHDEGEKLYDQGMLLFLQHKINEAMIAFEKAAQLNNSNALYQLGYIYDFSEGGVKQDYMKAMKYYIQACQQKHADALYAMGVMHEQGKGVPINNDKAIKYFQQSGGLENYQAMNKFEKLTRQTFTLTKQLEKNNIESDTIFDSSNKKEVKSKKENNQENLCSYCIQF